VRLTLPADAGAFYHPRPFPFRNIYPPLSTSKSASSTFSYGFPLLPTPKNTSGSRGRKQGPNFDTRFSHQERVLRTPLPVLSLRHFCLSGSGILSRISRYSSTRSYLVPLSRNLFLGYVISDCDRATQQQHSRLATITKAKNQYECHPLSSLINDGHASPLITISYLPPL
jgi:hypothetical protein